ncbi:MAG: hypothetical protein FWH11_06045 [Micrococcales bacterium]|nr:hypothetical protein [Micrococcales bacterium]
MRDQQRRLALVVTTDLGVPDEPAASTTTDMTGRWNILDRGVRPLVVRSDGTFTLFDHRDGRTDGRWLRVSDTFVSLFVDGPKRHSMSAMPDGRVFLSRYALPGSASTPELLFRSVLSFEGTWETPYRDRASRYTPAPPTQMSLGADRTFCADLGRSGQDGAVLVWSGIWARTDDTTATLDYVAWEVADGARRMAGHGQTTLELHEDGTMTVAALDKVFYPAPGTVRAVGDAPLATAEEPDVLLCPLAVEDPPEAETEPDAPTQDGEAPPEGRADQDAAPARRRRRRAVRPEGPAAAQRLASEDAVGTVELPPLGPAQRLASQRDAVATTELELVDLAGLAEPTVGNGAVLPVARTTADDGTPVVVVLHVAADGLLQVGALPAPADEVADRLPASPSAAAAQDTTQMLPVAVTTVDGTRVVVVLYVDENDDLQVGAVPTSDC